MFDTTDKKVRDETPADLNRAIAIHKALNIYNFSFATTKKRAPAITTAMKMFQLAVFASVFRVSLKTSKLRQEN